MSTFQLSGSTPIEFVVSGQNGMEYIALKNSFMSVKARILHSSGKHVLPTEYVGPVNLFIHALFDQVDVTLQNKIVTSATGQYSYKAMIQTLLKYGNDAKTSQLSTQLWEKDIAGYLDDNDVKTGQNTSLFNRSVYFAENKSVHMIAPICHDLFKLDRYMLNQVGLMIKFYRSKPQFCLMTDELNPDYYIHIDEMVLNICKVQINPAVIYAHSQTLKKTPAKYPLIKTDVRMSAIAQGQVNYTYDNVCQGLKPNRLIAGFVNSQAVAGNYLLSPWNFQGYDLNQISVSVDGVAANGNPVKVNFNSLGGTDTTEPFMWLIKSSGKWLNDQGNQINIDDTAGGFALYAFELEPTYEDGTYLTVIKQGNVRVDAQFNKPLPHPVCCIIYTESTAYFEVTLSRDIVVYQ